MNAYLITFFLAGAILGATSFGYRHLFSEGPYKPGGSTTNDPLNSRIFWLLICIFLWPVLLLTGLNSLWILAKRKRSLSKAALGKDSL